MVPKMRRHHGAQNGCPKLVAPPKLMLQFWAHLVFIDFAWGIREFPFWAHYLSFLGTPLLYFGHTACLLKSAVVLGPAMLLILVTQGVGWTSPGFPTDIC